MKKIISLALFFFATASMAQGWQVASKTRGIKSKRKDCVSFNNKKAQDFVDRDSGKVFGRIPVGAKLNICHLGDANSFSGGPLILINPLDAKLNMRFLFAHVENGVNCKTDGPIYAGTWKKVDANSRKRINMNANGKFEEKFPENYCFLVQFENAE